MKIRGVAANNEGLPMHQENGTRTAYQPGTVVMAPVPMQSTPPAQGCTCDIPPSAPQVVKQTRILSIIAIAMHSVSLAILGFVNCAQWVASLCGIIAGGVLLCCFTKAVYTCVPIVYIVALVFDLTAAILWIDADAGWVAIFPVLCIVVLVPATICGFKSCNGWQGTILEHAGPVVSVHQSTLQAGKVVPRMPQPSGAPSVYAEAYASVQHPGRV